MASGLLPSPTPQWPQWKRRHTVPELSGPELAEAVSSALESRSVATPPVQLPHSRSESSNRTIAWSEDTKSNTVTPVRSSALSPSASIYEKASIRSDAKHDRINDLAGDEERAGEPQGPSVEPRQILASSWLGSRAWRIYWTQEVAGDVYLEAQLLLMTMTTGVLDAMTNSTYHVFTSKQTGNTLDLAQYAFGERVNSDPLWRDNLGVAMGVFILGAAFFGQIGHITHQRRRAWLILSNAFQAALILGAAGVRFWSSRDGTGSSAMIILSMLAFAESGQIATALNVNMPELNTTMVTGALILLVTDRKFLELHNPKRNRRVLFFVSFFAGCAIGVACLRYANATVALVTVASMKCALVATFLFNNGVVERRQIDGTVSGTVTPASRVLWGD